MKRSESTRSQPEIFNCFTDHVIEIFNQVGLQPKFDQTTTIPGASSSSSFSSLSSENLLHNSACLKNCMCDSCKSLPKDVDSNQSNNATQETQETQELKQSVNNQNLVVKAQGLVRPIYTRDARRHNYDFTYHDCILSMEELKRQLPDCQLTVGVLTFNMAGKSWNGPLNDLLLPERVLHVPDIYAVGVQEAFSREPNELRDWTVQLQATLGPSHVLLHSASCGVLHLSLFIRRELVWFVSAPEDDSHLCRPNPPSNLIRTKGAVGIALQVFGTSMLFVNCHLPAHQARTKERLEECNRLISGLQLPNKSKNVLTASYQSADVTARFDACFWFGDLNFRVEQKLNDSIRHLKMLKDSTEPTYEELLAHDQLLTAIAHGQAFRGFYEPEITFPPTYKYIPNSDHFDEASTRVPSYCDRILYRTRRVGLVRPLVYDSLRRIKCSDHRPVFGAFHVRLRPGHQDVPLNGGNFQHDVYLAGLKKRQQAHERPLITVGNSTSDSELDHRNKFSRWSWRLLGNN